MSRLTSSLVGRVSNAINQAARAIGRAVRPGDYLIDELGNHIADELGNRLTG